MERTTDGARGRWRRRRVGVLVALTVPALAGGALPAASADAPTSVGSLAVEPALVAGGPGNQTDPHVDGDLVVLTDTDAASSQIRYADLAGGTGGVVPNAGHRDSLPDVAGSVIVFRRIHTDGSTAARPIMVFDVAEPELGARELAPAPGARREEPDIGGRTVAFVQQSGPSSAQSDVCVADLVDPAAPAVCLTADGADRSNRTPAVSPDGTVVVFTTCLTTGLACDIRVSRRGPDGSWAPPVALTGPEGEDVQPDTDGTIVTWSSTAGGNSGIWWRSLDGSAARQLESADAPGSLAFGPEVSHGVISFERELPGDTRADLWLYRPATGQLHRLTDSVEDDTLSDLSVQRDGRVRLVWAQPDGLQPGHNDVHTLTARLDLDGNEPPVVDALGDVTVDATGQAGAEVVFTVTATDDRTASPAVACAPPSGSLFRMGSTEVSCVATDDEGLSSAPASFTVTVRGAEAQLGDLLDAVTGVGPGTSLADKIRSASAALDAGDAEDACDILRAFVDQVSALSGRRLGADVAAALVEDASRIRAVLGCDAPAVTAAVRTTVSGMDSETEIIE